MIALDCAGCTACCRGDRISLTVEDDPSQYDTVVDGDRLVLRRVNGNCVYLGAEGCTIHGRAPALCKAFDCRLYFQMKSRQVRRAMTRQNPRSGEIFAAAKARGA
jgi:uncharacterized protein